MANSDSQLSRSIADAIQDQQQVTKDLTRALQQQASQVNNAVNKLTKQALAASQLQAQTRQLHQIFQNQKLERDRLIEQAIVRNKLFFEQFDSWIKEWSKNLSKWDKEQKDAIERFANLGWYLDPHMPWSTPMKVVEALDSGNKEDVVEVITQYFRERADSIQTEVEASYPNRKFILYDAFQAHRDEQYNLSIPVLLIQADGMWWDKFSSSIFIQGDRKNTVKDQFSKAQEHLYDHLFQLLEIPLPLWISRSSREATFNELNRHQILHGETVSYGTEQNSLKVISLISWLNWILNKIPNTEE